MASSSDQRMEAESAEVIQKWWRKKLEVNRRVEEKARNISESRYLAKVSLQNDALLAKLEKLRKEKRRDAMRYERILNMPARDVNAFMRKEVEREKESEELTILEKHELEERHKAARVIQRTFRKFYRSRLAKKYLRSLNIIKPSKRVAFLEAINDKLGKKKSIRAVPLEEIRSKLAEHKAIQNRDADLFAKRQQMIQDMKRASISITMTSLELIEKTSLLSVSNPLANYKAQKFHKTTMEAIKDNDWL